MTIATLIEKFQEDISWLGYNETEMEIIEHIKRAITLLKEQESVRCKNCRSNHQCSIQFKFADADDEEEWFCGDFSPSSGQEDEVE